MKNRYLFKAKRVDNGEWVKGYLFSDGMINSKRMFVGSLVITDYEGTACDEWNIETDFCEVIPETICQCTGLTDKNGRKIFESDIIHIGDKSIPYIVEWHDTGFMGKAIKAMDRIGLKYWSAQIEVIGNKFDNPELLEVEDEIN